MNTHKSMRIAALAVFLAASVVALTTAGPGTGTAIISPSSSVPAGSVGTWSVSYTAAEVHDNGTLRITIPSAWTAPQNGSASTPGFVTISTDEPTGLPGLSIAGHVITVVVDTLNAGSNITVVYGDGNISALGRAVAATGVGSYPFLVESDPLDGTPAPLVSSPSINVIPTTPASLELVPNDSTGVAAGNFVELHVRVLDTFDNRAPVASNRTVNLFATHGQFFDPSNHSTPITSIVIASGTNVKRVDYRGTLVAGSPHTINAFTPSGSPSLGGSTTVGLVAGALSLSQSTISATSPVVADGSTQSDVEVTSRDAFGNPRQGDTATIAVTGANAVDVDPSPPTDANGQTSGVVVNTVAELVTVSAAINTQAIVATAPIQFIAGPVNAAMSDVAATTPVVGNGIATSTITVTVRDANSNPVSGRAVTLAVTPPGNGTLNQPGGVTNALGQVTGTLTSTVIGNRTVTATVDGSIPLVDDAAVLFTAGSIASFQWTVDGNSTAGAFENVTLRVRDSLGNTVTNYTGTVSLSTTTGGVGDGVVQWDAVLPDANGTLVNLSEDDATYTFVAADNGVATLRVTNTRAETFQVRAQDGAVVLNSSNIVNGSAAADRIELVSGNGQTATVGAPVIAPPTVRVRDQFNNVVNGATVTFTAVGGGGSVDVTSGGAVDSTGITAGDGRIDCDVWTLGTTAGLNVNRLRARIASGTITSFDFTATGVAGSGINLDITPNSKAVTQGTFEVVTATLTDVHGNPKSGERIDIVIKSGLNGTLAEDPVDPGTTTALNPQARYGSTDATGRVTVRWVAPGGAGLADVIDASTAGVPQSSVVDATYTTNASGATNLRITFVGPSTRPANVTYQFLVEAVDGNNNVDPTNISTIDLTPEVGGNLTFSLTDFGATVTQVALVNGTRTVYGRGTATGEWDITAAGGGLGADTEVVTITDTGVIDHYAVTTVPSVVAGVVFDVTVEAQDVYNNRVLGANNVVTLEAYDDVANTPAQALLLDANATLASGRVTVAETYSKAEAIRVRASASGDEGFSGVVTVSAAPAYRIAKVSGDGAGIVAGANRVLVGQVLDQFDNPVANAPVSFVMLEGGGAPVPSSASTDVNGNVSTTYTTGITVDDNRIKATIGDENPPSLERVEYLVSTIPGPVASLQVTPASYSLVAGTGVALNVTGFDANSNLVSNDDTTPINLTETGSAQFGAASGVLTDGQFNTTVVDTVAESFTITATRQGGGATGTSAPLTVAHAGAYRVVKFSGDASGVTVGAAQPLEVVVRDLHGNPVPNALVTFATTGTINDGSFVDTSGDPNDGIAATNSAGHASVTFTTSTTAGANNVNATILDGNPAARERVTFTVNTVAGGIAYYTVQMSGLTAVAGTTRNVTVTAYDSANNVVDDDVTQVDLSGDPGNGLVFGADPVTLTNGVATTTVRADLVQTYRVRAGVLPAASGLGDPVVVSPALPAGIITATPSPATITANGISISTITSGVIRDAFTNPVPVGTLINVNTPVPTNGGVIVGPSARAVASDGTITFDLRSSATPGTSTVTMASQAGTATGTVNVDFAPRPAFVAGVPTPGIVVPGANVSFSVVVQNTSSNDANLTTGTTFGFTDGARTYSANIAAPITIIGGGNQTLVFASAVVNGAFIPGPYQPTVTLVGVDENGAPFNTPTLLPASSLLITSIQITAITAPAVVSRGQTPTVTVFVRNNGTQPTTITDIDLNFTPGTGIFTPDTIAPQVVAPTATAQFNIPVLVDPSCPVNTYTIDAVATGDVSGQTVTDNSIAPFPPPTWQIIAAANLSYVAGTMTPMTVTRGDAYQFRATIANGGAGVVSLDSNLTYIRFTDGPRTYEARPSQPYALAGSSQQQIVFKTRAVASNFTIGSYVASFHLQGLEGGAGFSQDINSGVDQIAVQTPANAVPGSVSPDQVSKGSSVAFTVQVNNTGGSTVVLTPATTEFRFAGGAFTADLNPSGQTTLPPGNTMLTFLSTPVSGAIAANTYPGQLVLTGTENGNPFSLTVATESVIVDDAPDIQILANTPSQSPITQDQTRPFKVRMVVRNNGGAAVTFTDASIKFIQAGQDRSGQFVISNPTGFALGGSTLNGGGAADTVIFDVSDNTGNTMTAPAMMTVQGFLEVEDVNTQQPIFAERELGDFLQVQTPAAFSVIAVLPSRTTVTQSMGRDFIVRALVQNTGTSDMTLNLTDTNTDVTFTPSAGWIAVPRSVLGHGGNVLTGGEIDTVLFDVTTSGSTTGTAQVNTTYRATETNTGRVVTGSTSNSAQIDVQSPGAIVVTSVVASRATITSAAGVAWTLTVSLQNTGQSDVNLNLGNAIGLTFQDATVQPAPLTRPSVLAGGGTVLSGGEVDQIVIGVGNSGTYSSPGVKNVGVNFTGIELNSNVAKNGGGNTSVEVQLQPQLNVVSVTPAVVSRGSIVAFAVTIVNATTNGATATLNPLTTRLVFGSGAYNVNLDATSPVVVDANQQITLLFNAAQIAPAFPVGIQNDATLQFRFVENDTPRIENEGFNTPPKRISVQAAPALNITSVTTSRQNVTVGQTSPAWHITMALTNANGSDVDLDLSSAITRLQLNLLGSGANVTSEYTIAQPTALFGGGEILSSGETDSLIFDVTQAGNTTGNVIVSGFVGGIDMVSTLPVTDNTGDGGSGSFALQSPGLLNVLSMTPQRPTATVSQAPDYTIKMAVRNDGQAAIDLDLTAPTTTAVSFSAPAGWATNVQTTLVGGGVRLSGGETDTVVFNVTTTGSTPALQTISGTAAGVEVNTGASRTDDTASGGTGTITVQSQAVLDIVSINASPSTLTDNAGLAQPWDVTIVVENDGQSAARLTLPGGLTIAVQSAPGAAFDPVNFLEEGGVVLAGGATGTLVAHFDAAPDFALLGARTIGATLNGFENNSNRPLSVNETLGSVTVVSPPNLTVALVGSPVLMTQGTQAFLQLDVTNPGINAATVDLDGGNTRVSFAGGLYSAVLQPVSPTVVGPNQTVRVSFESKVVDAAIPAGSYPVAVDLAYTANGLDATENENIPGGVTVQVPAAFRITGITTSQPSVTRGQSDDWTATMAIVNEGASPIDLNLAAAATYLQFVVPGGGFDTGYGVIQPTELVGGGTQLGVGATGDLVFTITQTGNTTGVIVISGRVEGSDGVATVFDDTFDGGRGSIAVVAPAAISVLSTRATQPRVTAGQTATWNVHVVVANTGGADVNLNLAASNITFSGAPGFVVQSPPTFLGGTNPLEGASVDSLNFVVTATSPNAGTRRIDASIPWQDVNNATSNGTANTATSGFGSVLVQTPVNILVTTTTSLAPNPGEVNTGQAFAVRIQVQNTGQADARDVAVALTSNGTSDIDPIPPVTEVAGGQTVVFDADVTASGVTNPSETFTSAITAAADENTGNPVTPVAPLDNTAVVAVQTPAVFEITNVRPSQASVTRGQTTPWNVIVRARNTGQADAVLAPPSASDLAFAIGGSIKTDYVVQPPTAFASGQPGWTLPGSAIDSLIYAVNVTGADTGLVDVTVTDDGTDRNDPAQSIGDTGGTTVRVQQPAGFAIATTLSVGPVNNATADRDTVNTGFAYEIHVTVDNSGEAVDSVLVQLTSDLAAGTRSTIAPASLRRQQIDVDGSHTFIYRITAPTNPVVLETFTSTILPGSRSRNTGLLVTAQPAIDNLHVVVTERRADLVMNLTSASGAVSTNQVFTMSATVTNIGQAVVEGTAEMTLALPAGFIHLNPGGTEPLTRAFVVGTPVTWQIQAPGAAQGSLNFSSTISTLPADRNLGTAAFASQPTDNFGVAVVSGGAFTSPTLAIATPAGAVDGTVSAGQNLTLSAGVTATTTTGTIVATLSVPAGFSIVGSPTRNMGTGTGAPVAVTPAFTVLAPANANVGDVFVTFTGIDQNTLQPVPTAADTVAITTVPRAALTTSALVTAPPEATDNSVTIGTTFTIQATVTNAAGAAGIASPGTLTISLPTGYTFAGDVAAKPFTIAAPVTWQINAAPQPSGPDQFDIVITTTPPDENSGQPALVVVGTATVAMVTEGSAVAVRDVSQNLGIDVRPVPAGTADVRLLGFEIAYNVSDASVADARIDTLAITIVGDDGTPLGPGTVGATLSRLVIDIGGGGPFEVVDPSTNPVVVSFLSGGAERAIAPDDVRNAVVSVSLDANPSATEFSVGLRTGGVVVRDSQSGQRLGVTDSQGNPLDGVITSDPLVVLSGSFDEYVHNYPNPFRAGAQDTRIAYVMDRAGSVSVRIYAIDGSLVYEENIPSGDSRTQAGPQETTWDGRNGQGEVVRNGVYVCVLNAGGRTAKFRIAVAK